MEDGGSVGVDLNKDEQVDSVLRGTKISRRKMLKLGLAGTASVATGIEIPELQAESGEEQSQDWPELPRYYEWGESRVEYNGVWFEVEDLAREWERFPDEVNEAIYIHFGGSGVFGDGLESENFKVKQAELLGMYNEVRQKTGEWMRLYRERKHDFEMRRYAGLLKDLVGVGIVVEQDIASGETRGVLGLVRLLKRLDEDKQLGREGRLERARLHIDETRNERTLSMSWDGSLAEAFGENESLEEAWGVAGLELFEMIERELPQGAVLFKRIEMSKQLVWEGLLGEARTREDVLRLSVLNSTGGFYNGWLETGIHELKHLLEPRFSTLEGVGAFEGAVTTDFGVVMEVMELMMEYDRTALEMMDLEITSAELFHVFGEVEASWELEVYERLVELAEEQVNELGAATLLKKRLDEIRSQGVSVVPLMVLPEAHELIYRLVKNGLGDNLRDRVEFSEETEGEYGKYAEMVMRQVEHFLVNPALDESYRLHIEDHQVGGGGTAKDRMLELHNRLDAMCVEFMSGGEIGAEEMLGYEKRLYAAMYVRLNTKNLGYDVGNASRLFPGGVDQPSEYYQGFLDEFWESVEAFFVDRDEFMRYWSGFMLNSVPEDWLENELKLRSEPGSNWEEDVDLRALGGAYRGYFELLDREVVEEFAGDNPGKWAKMVELGMDEWIYGVGEGVNESGSGDITDYLLEEPVDFGE